jgi:AAA+ ATPase superfamily predicted ATPase
MKNPFVYGETVTGVYFCNRIQEIRELVNDIKNGTNVIIFSPRRYGKTSLINQVLEIARQKGIISFYVDLYPAINKQKFIEIYAQAISSGLTGKTSRIVKKLKEYLPRIIPKVVMDDQSVQFEFEFDRRGSLSPHVDDLLKAAKKVADQHNKNAVVVFDEFQEIASFDDQEIERKMRSVFQHHRNVSYIFMGSKTHLTRDIFNNPNRPFYKSGKHFPLGKIDSNELGNFAAKKFKTAGINITEHELKEIIEVTECHPYYFQMLCHVLWEITRDDKAVKLGHIEEAVGILISRESSAYMAIWDSLTAKQKNLLIALMQEHSPAIYSRQFLEKHGLGAPSSLQKATKKLISMELIQQANGSYELVDLFFKRWVRHTWG